MITIIGLINNFQHNSASTNHLTKTSKLIVACVLVALYTITLLLTVAQKPSAVSQIDLENYTTTHYKYPTVIITGGPSSGRLPGSDNSQHGGKPGFSISGSNHMGGELHLNGGKQKISSAVIHTDNKQYPGHQISISGTSFANGKVMALGEANSQIKVQGYRDKTGAPDEEEAELKSGIFYIIK